LDQMLLYLGGDRSAARIYRASLGLGLSVAANLTLLVPGTALALVFLTVLLLERKPGDALDHFVVPGMVACFVIVVLPLARARLGDFDFGMPSLGESLRDLVAFSLYHHPLASGVYALLPAPGFWFAVFGYVLVPAVLGGAAVGCLVAMYRRTRRWGTTETGGAPALLLLIGGSLPLSVGLLAVMNWTLHIPYPAARMGQYLIPMFTLAALALMACAAGRRVIRWAAGIPAWILGLAIVWHYLAHFNVTHYGGFRYDASTKRIVGLIRERQARRPLPKVRVGNTWLFAPSVNFYRRMYGLDWMAPLDRRGADGEFDYYVLHQQDAVLLQKRSLRVLYRDPFAEVYFAEPGAGPVVRE
ncbi:MAG TPA: hypothetical protein VLH09_06080, partial [Bryobacteraceae bacterium]|nr:hypothetical protein [Bryobacteraceae bacterium]